MLGHHLQSFAASFARHSIFVVSSHCLDRIAVLFSFYSVQLRSYAFSVEHSLTGQQAK